MGEKPSGLSVTEAPVGSYKVRIAAGGSNLHVVSSTEPVVELNKEGKIKSVAMQILPEYGDTIGFIDWGKVTRVTWRQVQKQPDRQRGRDLNTLYRYRKNH